MVSGLDNLEEALWYAKGIDEDNDIQQLLNGKKHRSLVISAENSELIGRGFTIEQYEKFYRDTLLVRNTNKKKTAQVELLPVENIDTTAKTETLKEGDKLPVKQEGKSSSASVVKETNKGNNSAEQKNSAQNKQEEKQKKEEQNTTFDSKLQKERENLQKEEEERQKRLSTRTQELKKYKGLYTYDVDADHKFVILITKEGMELTKLESAIEKFNNEKMTLLNLKISQTQGNGFPKIVEVGNLPGAKMAKSYLLQLAKDDNVREALNNVPHRRIVISNDNLDVLKKTGKIDIYMELFRRLYLGR